MTPEEIRRFIPKAYHGNRAGSQRSSIPAIRQFRWLIQSVLFTGNNLAGLMSKSSASAFLRLQDDILRFIILYLAAPDENHEIDF